MWGFRVIHSRPPNSDSFLFSLFSELMPGAIFVFSLLFSLPFFAVQMRKSEGMVVCRWVCAQVQKKVSKFRRVCMCGDGKMGGNGKVGARWFLVGGRGWVRTFVCASFVGCIQSFDHRHSNPRPRSRRLDGPLRRQATLWTACELTARNRPSVQPLAVGNSIVRVTSAGLPAWLFFFWNG